MRAGTPILVSACPVCGAEDWRAAPAGNGERVFCARCDHNDGAISVFWSASAP